MDLSKLLKTFIEEDENCDFLRSYQVLVIRRDGICLYEQFSGEDSLIDSTSIGALLAGVSQAAGTLTDFTSLSKDDDTPLRMSFETSSKGIHILPLSIQKELFYISIIYKDEVNPGKLKAKFRNMTFKIEEYFEEYFEAIAGETSEVSTQKDEQLEAPHGIFSDISDNEIDQLFSTLGN